MAKNTDPRDAEIAALRAELAAAKAATIKRLTCRVSEKKAVSVYGLGRFPTTLYASQWRAILSDEGRELISGFIDQHAGELATRD